MIVVCELTYQYVITIVGFIGTIAFLLGYLLGIRGRGSG